MDAGRVLILLQTCGLELPPEVANVNESLDAIRNYDAGPGVRVMPDADQLGTLIFAETLEQRGEVPDVLKLIAAERLKADQGLAYSALEKASERGQSRLEGAMRRAAGQLLAAGLAAVEAVYAEVQALPNDCPLSSEEAGERGTAEQIEAFRQLRRLNGREQQLRALQRELVGQLEPYQAPFFDTPEPAAAPEAPLARLRWKAERAAFYPSAEEMTTAYQASLTPAQGERRAEQAS
jgi:hypothetical protein